jgi:uncharacterized metal-binding protein
VKQDEAMARSVAEYRELPLVYSCSGCSGAAQLANALAIRLDRARLAEMSCVAGVGGDVSALLRTARSGRRVVVLDGCRLHCAWQCLARHAIPATLHIDLSRAGIERRLHEDVPDAEAQRVWQNVVLPQMAGLRE